MLFLLLFWQTSVIFAIMFATVTSGMLVFSVYLLCQLEGLYLFLGILFFPLFLLLGVGYAFKEFFLVVISESLKDWWDYFYEGYR